MSGSGLSPVELASAERTPADELRSQAIAVSCLGAVTAALSAVPAPVIAVNANRQIVYANEAMVGWVGAETAEALIGLRPGEALGCVHVLHGENGCGTSPFCRYCGAARAVVESGADVLHEEEAHIIRRRGDVSDSLDVRVSSRTFRLDHHVLTVLTITDISDQKRRHALERIFFHDILNTVQKMITAIDIVDEVGDDHREAMWELIRKSVLRLSEEIQAQRDLADMERHDLALKPTEVSSRAFVKELVESYLDHGLVQGRRLSLAPDSENVPFVVDQVKLRRVLDNMIRNALEAEGPDAIVTVGCRFLDGVAGDPPVSTGTVEFWVHNPTVMPESVRRQVFHRSFTTKGKGHGLGTYSMRMLTERYLDGEITFSSQPGEGTIFRVRYPIKPSYAS